MLHSVGKVHARHNLTLDDDGRQEAGLDALYTCGLVWFRFHETDLNSQSSESRMNY
jgi:hypothetical protein